MKTTTMTLNIFAVIAANVLLTSCAVFEGKEAVDNRRAEAGIPARAYVAAPNQKENENLLMLVQTASADTNNVDTSSAASLAAIAPAAGPGSAGATAQVEPVIIKGGTIE